MARLLNPVTGTVEEIDDSLTGWMDTLWARLADPDGFPAGLPAEACDVLMDAYPAAIRSLAQAESIGESELAARGVDAVRHAFAEAVTSPPAGPGRRAPARLIVPWQPVQLARVQDGLPGRYQLTTDLGATLGLRQGENLGCCLEDLQDLDGRKPEYLVRQQVKHAPGGRVFAPPKNGRERRVPVPADLRDRIRDHVAAYGAVPVTLPWGTRDGKPRTRTLLFTTLSGTSLDRSYFNRLFRAALIFAGIEPGREAMMHMLRNIAASRWIADGADLLMVRDLLGHADTSTTERYVRRLKTHDARTRRVVARAQPKTPRRRAAALPPNVIGVDFPARRRTT